MAEQVTTTEAAEILGLGSPHAARKQLHRMGIKAVARQPGRGGESLYNRAEIETAQAHRPGRGRRGPVRP